MLPEIVYTCPCCKKILKVEELLKRLESIENVYKRNIEYTSGYRCKVHNEKVKGSKNSSHLYGEAVDIKCTPGERYGLISLLLWQNFTRIIICEWGIHADIYRDPKYPLIICKGSFNYN